MSIEIKMASNEPIEDSLHKLLTCNICQIEIDELKALPCQHTICLSCVKQLPVFKNRFNCSICHKEYPVPNGGFRHLPDSLVCKQLKDLIKPHTVKDSKLGSDERSNDDAETSPQEPVVDIDVESKPTTAAKPKAENKPSNKMEMADDKSVPKTLPIIANGGFGYVPSQKGKFERGKSEKGKFEKGKSEKSKASQKKQVKIDPRNAEQSGRPSPSTSPVTMADRQKLRKELSETLEMGKRWCKKADEMMAYYTGALEVLPEHAKSTKEKILEYQKKVKQQCQEKLEGLDKGLAERTLVSKATLEELEPCSSQMKTVLDSVPRNTILRYYGDDYGDDISAEKIVETQDSLQKLQAANQTVKEASFDVSDFNYLRDGDCVRLKTFGASEDRFEESIDSLLDDLMKNKVTHASIGRYRGTSYKSGYKCKVIFPEQFNWMGPETSITKCPGKVNLPCEGDKVKVKPSVVEPRFSWNGVRNKRSCGLLKEIKDEGPGNDLVVIVNFPENSSWKGLYSEITLAPSCGLEIGDEVWVNRAIPEPSRGWAGVNGSSVGKVKHIEGDEGQEEVTVDFPECNDWIGLATELQMVREPQKDEKVQVKLSVTEPRLGWGGASHDDVGNLEEIAEDFNEFGRIGYVKFPGKPRCPFIISDLEPARYQVPSYEDNSLSVSSFLFAHLMQQQNMFNMIRGQNYFDDDDYNDYDDRYDDYDGYDGYDSCDS